MPRRLLLAPFSAHDATERLLREALELVPGPDYRSVVYLCPSPRKLRDTQHRFLGICGLNAVYPPVFATPGQYARDLHARFADTARFPPELRPLLVRKLMDDGSPHRTLGYARAVGEFIRDIKTWVPDHSGMRETFEDELAGFDRPLSRALEALELLDRYDAELRSHNRCDDEDVWTVAAGLVPKVEPPRVLVLDGFAAPNPLERLLLRALVEASDSTFACCFSGDDQDPDYALASGFRGFIESLGGIETTRLEPEALPDPRGLCRFADPESEIDGICRFLRSRPELGDTVVAMPDLAARAPMVRRVFEQYGLPVTTYPEGSLDASGPVADVLELLRALDSGFERVPTAAALSSPWLPGLMRLPEDTGHEERNRAARALDHLSRRAGIIKGRAEWSHLCARLLDTEQDIADSTAEFFADVESRVNFSFGVLEDNIGSLDHECCRTTGEHAAGLKRLLERLRFCQDTQLDPTRDDEWPRARSALYDVLDGLAGFEADFGAERESRSRFIRTLEYLVRLRKTSPDPPPSGVLVVRLEESIGLHPSRAICAGLTESNLPGGCHSDPILPERLLRRLDMPDMDWHRDWQRFHLRRTIESARDEVFLTFHDSVDNKPVLPTPLLQLDTYSLPKQDVLYAAVEEQLAAGRRAGVPFAVTARTVDFSRDLDVRAALERRFGPDRAIPVTGIESFRRCPYRFYLERVLGLESPPEPQYEIDASQWGSVIHRCLSLLYEKGPVPVADLPEKARAALDRALSDFGLPLFWAETTRRVFDNFLPSFVEIEKGLRDQGFSPMSAERRLEGQVTDEVRVKGRLDRLDGSSDSVRVLDYKTGAAGIGPKQVLDDRTHVQLPLYARLVGNVTGRPVDNCGVYSTREARVRWLADDRYPMADLVAAALETTVEAVRAMRSGDFPSRPATDSICRECDYAYLCPPVPAEEV